METGPHQDPPRFQCVYHRFCITITVTLHSQTELAINTHATVSGTYTMVSDIHRTIVQGQEGNGSTHPSVSDIRIPAITE